MNLKVRVSFVLVLCLLVSSPLLAQVSTGTPNFGSFASTPAGTLNLGNLNLHLSIPIVQKKGRATDFNYSILYDSSVWYPTAANGVTTWQPVGNFGWTADSAPTLGFLTGAMISKIRTTCVNDGGKTVPAFVLSIGNYVYTDKFGARHAFTGSAVDYGCGEYAGFSELAPDGSGYTLDTAADPIGTVYDRSGTVVASGYLVNGSSSSNGSYVDSNGNKISVTSNVFTDTLGTTALTISGGASGAPLVFSYPAPSGSNAQAKLTYKSYAVKTAFGCSSVPGEYSATTYLVDQLALADGTAYQFTYEPTPGSSSTVTGRIASITLPTGGTTSIAYSGGSNGIVCSDGTTAGMQITSPDGATIYARSGSGTAWTTTVTDAQQNQTSISFQTAKNNFYETSRLVYQGLSTGSGLLATVNTCYNGATSNCSSTTLTLPISTKDVYTTLNGRQSRTLSTYNAYGLATKLDAYDYGAGSYGGLLSRKAASYSFLAGNNSTYLVRVGGVAQYDGSDLVNPIAKTTYAYDETTPVSTSGISQHSAVTGSRGNLTTVTSQVSGTLSQSRTYTYFDTGLVNTSTDVNGGVTTYTYGACGNSLPTSALGPTGLTVQATWDSACTGGVQVTTKDVNGNTTTMTYSDPYSWRPASVSDAAGNITSYTYTGATAVENATPFNNQQSATDVLTSFDSLGRTQFKQVRQAPGSSTFDTVQYGYDNKGRSSTTTLPYAAAAATAPSAFAGTTALYDALSRPLAGSDSGGGSVSYTYAGNDVLVQAGQQRQYEYDGLGRLTSVCEITGASDKGTCGQTTTASGYWTKYVYNGLGKITSVTQNAQAASASQQIRTFSYDRLGRLLTEANPENGITTYTYDTDAICGTYTGDLVKKVDAVGNVTCYAYDKAHRITDIIYPSGSYAAATAAKHFVYDAATINGTAILNGKGQLVEAYTGTSASKITDLIYSYSVLGQPTDVYEKTPHSGTYYHLTASYWPNGATSQLSGIPAVPLISYTPDGEGRINGVTANSTTNPYLVTATTYNSSGQATGITFGSLDSDVFNFDPNTGRPTGYQYKVNNQSVLGSLTWTASGNLSRFQVTADPFNSANVHTCDYVHDNLSRIASANCGATWSQTFSYDPFGNIKKDVPAGGTGISFQASYPTTTPTNRISSLPGGSVSYDANGNMTNDSLHAYSWDADGNPVAADSASVVYDAFDRTVEQASGSSYTQILYSPSGAKLALATSPTVLKMAFIPLPAGATAVYNSTGLAYYRHPDWLGSSRFASTPSRTMYSSTAYAPFGESYSEAGTKDRSFTGQGQDTAEPLYDFLFRKYSSTQGRWISPDPAGLGAVDPANPQSWNRYAYVLNNPLRYIDPLGRDCAYLSDDGTYAEFLDQSSDEGECGEHGGYWVDGGMTRFGYNDDGSLWITGTDGTNVTNAWYPGSSNVGSTWTTYDPFSFISSYYYQLQQQSRATPTSQQYIQAIANAAPTICGGGAFGYYGKGVTAFGAKAFTGGIVEADSRSGISGGSLNEVGVAGVGGGSIVSSGGSGGLVYTEVGEIPFLGNVGLVGFPDGVGVYAEGEAGNREFGGGLYMNVTTNAGCK